MPNNKKYYLISVGLAIAIHISLALLMNQSLNFALSSPNKLSLKLVATNEQTKQHSLEPSQVTKAQEPDSLATFNKPDEQKLTELNTQKIDQIEANINEPKNEDISKGKSPSPINTQKPQKKPSAQKQSLKKTQAAQNPQVQQNIPTSVNSQSLQSSQEMEAIAQQAQNSQNRGTKISRPAKIDFQRGIYPSGAKLRGEEGTCVLLLTISPEAKIIQATLETSSTYPRLDEAALKYALDPNAKHKIEAALANGQAIEATILVNVHFRLTNS